jgi:hypothetical protein
MADTGWVSPGTVVSDDTVGSFAWSNPSNAKTSNDSDASASPLASDAEYDSEYLKATNFGLAVPVGSTIDGIEVEIEMSCGYDFGTQPTENEVKIVKSDGGIGSTNRATGANIPGSDSSVSYGGSSDLWGETWSSTDINDIDFGVVFSGTTYSDPFGQIISVDHIQIKVYYTESSGTEANSERGLYIEGYDTNNSERGLYSQGYLTNNSERNIYLEGFVDSLYSRGSDGTLGTDDSNLTTTFSTQDYTDVGTDNDTYVDLEGIEQYFQFLFKEPNANNTDDFRITWKGKSSLAPSSSTVYLQIYNRNTTSWTTIASNNTANANTKFTLTYDVTTSLSDYYDANYVISARVYQDGVV